ncbi:MAG: hypothetical protein FJ291_29685 [Planctomycetes bacterium]|nr:hypothetical protein [Planctomycetota bacterium]
MERQGRGPALRPLHSQELLSQAKLDKFGALETRVLVESLRPGQPGSLKTRPDGTMLDGHHRVAVLRERGFAVDGLPREVVRKASDEMDRT